ncbi:coniferyl aldehyde dehydrogenase [Metallibacterium sp.]|uniref:coniferyl aldehyde dehydrogenase n=1 Tax=Metallibacterium sp. TaxID=2940281 RepID=UPI00260C101F|nr:coniferyl aldehyde dehydrogenase [Metallibacterium sp.]
MDTRVSESELRALLDAQRMAWARNMPDYAQRMDDLARLRAAFQARFAQLAQAMSDDFGQRSRHESQLSDQMTVLHDIDHVRRHLKRWMWPRRCWADAAFFPARIEIRARPLGVVGVIAPWNYPVSLALMPLLEALAAGNHVMLKPSELTPRTSAALAELIAAVFPRERVTVVQGDAAVGAAFAALPFDHLVFTGSTAVGRKVALAAAANLTPVTLELGGKSPAIIAPGYALDTAAARIAQGKLLNAGQTCVAPDYVLLPRGTRAAFVQASRDYVRRHYPSLRSTPDFSSIVSDRHYARLHALVDDARAKGAEVITLPDANAHDAARRVFAPTLLLDVGTDMRVLQEEIFGPILPLLEYDTVEEAVAAVNQQPRPLALYVFDDDARRAARVLEAVPAGGVGLNDTVVQFAQTRLPFGGIGASGMGHLHGHAGFVTFSKLLPVFRQSRWSGLALLRPPYGKLTERMLRWLAR